MSKSATINEGRFEAQSGNVYYNVTRLNECSHPECDSRRNYGVRVTKLKPNMILDTIPFGKMKQTKSFCPKHRSSVPESKEALNREHEEALDEWKKEKRKRRKREYHKITGSDMLPKFRYVNGRLRCENDRFGASGFGQFEDAVDYLSGCDIDVPVLAYDNNRKYAIVKPKSSNSEFYDIYGDSMISYEKFEERFSDVEYVDRQFYSVKTNVLTGIDMDTAVNEIQEHIDDVIEWKEYNKTQGYIDLSSGCHLCNSGWGDYHYSRVIRDGKEVIIVTHNRGSCEKIIGEINPKMIDEESYDIVDID